MARFLSGEFVPSISWLEQKQGERDLIRPGHSVRGVVAPIAVATLILFRKSFLPGMLNLMDMMMASSDAIRKSSVVDFSDADTYFNSNPLIYAMGAIYALIVSGLRKLHLLL
jgi:hypothetical protein